jgi:response regulator of citrate/malate metabolism
MHDYDIVIADIMMQGNEKLQLTKTISEQYSKLPVILITGRPTLDTAIQSLQLSVIAYLLKPFEFSELLGFIDEGLQYSKTKQTADRLKERLNDWKEYLDNVNELMIRHDMDETNPESFVNNSFYNIFMAMSDIEHLFSATYAESAGSYACHALNCPRYQKLQDVISEAITVIDKTKKSFKSKELALLKKKLEQSLLSQSSNLN